MTFQWRSVFTWSKSSGTVSRPTRVRFPLSEGQRYELDRRLEAYELDRDTGRPAEDVVADIRKRL